MLKPFWVDLHIHTALSPCGSLEMGAPEIVSAAWKAGVDVIGIADHNTCDNFPAISEAAHGDPVVLPCIETQSAEDIHTLCVFPDFEKAVNYKSWLWKKMLPIKNDVDYFGDQVVLDHCNNILRQEDTLLIQGSGYEVDQIISKVQELGGLAILAHVDRASFSYPVALGPMPVDYPADAFELSRRINSEQAEAWRGKYPGRTFIRSSDSHTLDTISRANCTKMMLEAPTFEEVKKAIRGEEGRRISWPWG